jgi:hypothetical protein
MYGVDFSITPPVTRTATKAMLMIGLLQVSAVWVCTPSFVTYTARLAREIVTWVLF